MRTMSFRSSSLAIALLAGSSLVLGACDNGSSYNADYGSDMEVEQATDAVAADQEAVPVVAEAPSEIQTDATPVESLPPEVRSSEESVQPESDTLFY